MSPSESETFRGTLPIVIFVEGSSGDDPRETFPSLRFGTMSSQYMAPDRSIYQVSGVHYDGPLHPKFRTHDPLSIGQHVSALHGTDGISKPLLWQAFLFALFLSYYPYVIKDLYRNVLWPFQSGLKSSLEYTHE